MSLSETNETWYQSDDIDKMLGSYNSKRVSVNVPVKVISFHVNALLQPPKTGASATCEMNIAVSVTSLASSSALRNCDPAIFPLIAPYMWKSDRVIWAKTREQAGN
jgi:hypothetical protein